MLVLFPIFNVVVTYTTDGNAHIGIEMSYRLYNTVGSL